jgi:hypothetical protein
LFHVNFIGQEGEKKSRSQNSCAYNADGKVQKTAIVTPVEPEEKKGLRGRCAEKKKSEFYT